MDHKNHQILSRLTQHLIDNPKETFGQALFNLGINEFANKMNPAEAFHKLRDIYNDTNEEILERIKK